MPEPDLVEHRKQQGNEAAIIFMGDKATAGRLEVVFGR